MERDYRPFLPKFWTVLIMDDEVQLISPERSLTIEGKNTDTLKRLLPFLNGKYKVKDIPEQIGTGNDNVMNLINDLRKNDIIVFLDDGEELSQEFNFYCRKLGYEKTKNMFSRFKNSSVLIIGKNSITDRIMKHLDKQKIKVKNIVENELENTKLKGYSLIVSAFTGRYPEMHETINKRCISENVSWISARYDGIIGEVGPLVVPFVTPCFFCYKKRLESNTVNLERYRMIENALKSNEENYGSLEQFFEIMSSFMSMEILNFLLGYEKPKTYGAVLNINFTNYSTDIDKIYKVPFCRVCGKE